MILQLSGRGSASMGAISLSSELHLPGFYGSKWAISIDLWVPMMMQKTIMPPSDLMDERGANWFGIIGRVRDGFTREQASDDLTRISTELARLYPQNRAPGTTARAVPEMQARFDDAGNVVMLSSGLAIVVVGILLLIVCANVANLMLARSLARQREIGIRLAVGAGRWRLIRQLLTESTILALAGGLLGLGVAYWTSDLFYFALPRLPVDFNLDFSPDSRVVALHIRDCRICRSCLWPRSSTARRARKCALSAEGRYRQQLGFATIVIEASAGYRAGSALSNSTCLRRPIRKEFLECEDDGPGVRCSSGLYDDRIARTSRIRAGARPGTLQAACRANASIARCRSGIAG